MNENKVMVIGAGTMGNGIAQVFASTGYEVLMVDVAEGPLEKGLATVAKSLGRQVKKERITEADSEAILARIGTSTNMADGADAFLAIEAATENIDIKRKIFEQLCEVVEPEAWLATNTSSISERSTPA